MHPGAPGVLDLSTAGSGGGRGPTAGTVPARGARTVAATRFPGLDGLRALAVLAVLVFHLDPAWLPGGYLGVDVFFVVSGFLITTLLVREVRSAGRVHLGAFWVRRARRLVPALLLLVLVTVPIARVVGGDVLVDLDRQVAGALTFSTNWREIAAGSSYFTDTAPLLFAHLWSLAVEEQFYLLWPVVLLLLLALVTDRTRRVAFVGALAAASAIAMAALFVPDADPTRVHYGTDTHAFGLMVGAALALAHDGAPADRTVLAGPDRQRIWAGPAGLLLLALLAATLHDDGAFAYRGGLLLAVLATGLVIAGLLGPRTPFARALELSPLRWIGRRSYGLYLWHWPVIVLLAAALPAAPVGAPWYWAARAVALVSTFGLAAASYRFVEEPVRRLGFRECVRRARRELGGPAPRAARVTAAVVAALLLTTAITAVTAPQESTTERAIREAEEQLAREEAAQAAELAARDYRVPSGEEVTAFGDSIMVTSMEGLRERFPGIDLRAKSIRQWPDGAQVVRDALAGGTVRRGVVLHFGTNAGIQDAALVREVIRELGPDRMIVLVNVYQYSHWVPATNEELGAIAQDFENVALADWAGAVAARPELLQADQVHPNREGGVLFADVVAGAFEALSADLESARAEAS